MKKFFDSLIAFFTRKGKRPKPTPVPVPEPTPVPVPTGNYPEEPAGYTPIYEHNFPMTDISQIKSAATRGFEWWAYDPKGLDGKPNWSFVNNGPGDASYARLRYPAGQIAGESPALLGVQFEQDLREIFDVTEFMIEGTDYEMQRPVGEKLLGFIGCGRPPERGGNEIVYIAFRPGSPDTQFVKGMRLGISLQDLISRNLDPNVNTDFWVTPGVKHTWAVLFKLNSAIDKADGEVWAWGDGVLRLHYNDVLLRTSINSAGQPAEYFHGFTGRKYDPTYGGAGINKTRDDFIRVIRLYGSGIPMIAPTPTPTPEPTPTPTPPPTPTPGTVLVAHDFNDGTLGTFGTWAVPKEKVDVIDDPTGSGKGKVARLRYMLDGAERPDCIQYSCDDNTSLVAPLAQHWGETVYFKGEFYFDAAEMMPNGELNYQRKLFYVKSHEDWSKYSAIGGGHRFRLVLGVMGDEFYYNATFEPTPGDSDSHRIYNYLPLHIQAKRWYTLENRLTMESSIGAGDGVWQVWLDGVLLFEKHDLQLTWQGWLSDQALEDIYFDSFLVGQQVNRTGSGFDEYRYWNNITFSRQRIV